MSGSSRIEGRGVRRRDFLAWGSLSGAALVLGWSHRDVFAVTHPLPPERFAPNQWLAIDESGAITIVAARSEMGQGVRTSIPMIVAEELGADWSHVTVVHARPSPEFQQMRTSGSGSVSGSWNPVRQAAASAREMLVSAAALAWNVPVSQCFAERNGVVHRESGRRLEFGQLVARASRLPVPSTPALKPQRDYTLLGTRVPRVDARAIGSGQAKFALDLRVPGMRIAAIRRSPRAGGKVTRVSDERARAVPGVSAVVRISNGVAVVANRTWAAFRGRDALEVEWDNSAASSGTSADYLSALEAALGQGKRARREGDVETALRAASRTMEATYRCPFQAHAAMEPLNCVAHVHNGRCELWVGTQAPNQAQEAVARLLGLPLQNVTINVMLIGGGFGRRLANDYILEAVEVSRAIAGPVQVVWSREDDIRHDMYQSAQVNRLFAGLDASGLPLAWRHQVADYHLGPMFGDFDPNYDPAASGDPWGGYDTPYAFPDIDVTLAVLEPPVPLGAWRAVTYPAAVFARESFLDEIAHATGRDPLALRLALLPSPGTVRRGQLDLPNGDRLRHVLQLAADRAGWSSPFARVRNARRWGRGLACNSYHAGTMVAQVVEASVGEEGDVRVHRVVSAVDCGQVINLSGLEAQFEGGVVWALSAALKGQITFADGRPEQSNFHDFPVLRANETPVMEVHVAPNTLRPFGAGEPPVPCVWPALANAVFMATGQRIRELPLRPETLRASSGGSRG